jgi:hypothetical protein
MRYLVIPARPSGTEGMKEEDLYGGHTKIWSEARYIMQAKKTASGRNEC